MSAFVELVLPEAPVGREMAKSFAEWAYEMGVDSVRQVHTRLQELALLAEFSNTTVGQQFYVVVRANYPSSRLKLTEV